MTKSTPPKFEPCLAVPVGAAVVVKDDKVVWMGSTKMIPLDALPDGAVINLSALDHDKLAKALAATGSGIAVK